MTLTREKYWRLKQECIDLLGGRCQRCGATKDLEFDHVKRTTKLFDLAGNLEVSRERRLRELAKCQLLCVPCHKAKTSAECKALIHGEKRTWNKGCRCTTCREGQRLRMADYRRRKLTLA